MKEELKFATEISEVQCMMMAGVPLMHKLCVDSWDIRHQVSIYITTTHYTMHSFNIRFLL